ncbi:hypothetical protein [Acinetobacter proteolyticus]|uniref:hypothetical protein n=1 Tax=Acinetobacter proteolyticus TaxID=1776741 RepID=UPI0009D71932|nr:hypothetical protein [Acinetobacter proteolyticus]
MKHILWVLAGIFLVAIIILIVPQSFSLIYTDKSRCREGCSADFLIIARTFTWTSLFSGGLIGYLFSLRKVGFKTIFYFIILIIFLLVLLSWYSTNYGYGLNLSY